MNKAKNLNDLLIELLSTIGTLISILVLYKVTVVKRNAIRLTLIWRQVKTSITYNKDHPVGWSLLYVILIKSQIIRSGSTTILEGVVNVN